MQKHSVPITEDEVVAYGITTPLSSDLTTSSPLRTPIADAVSDLATPYVSSSVEYPFYWGGRAVPREIDEAEREFGVDIYDKMAADSRLGAAIRTFKVGTLANGLTVLPSHSQVAPGSPASEFATFEKSCEIRDYVNHVLERLARVDRPITDTLWNALDCAYKGHKLAEMTADLIVGGPYDGLMGLASFRTKPRENYALVLDSTTNRFLGVIGKVPGGSIALRTGLVWDAAHIPNMIAAEKLINFTLDDRDGDPRGKSWLRDSYDPWYRKQQMKVEHLKALMRFAGGMISVICPEEDKAVRYQNPVTGKYDTLMNCCVAAASQMSNGRVGGFHVGTQLSVHFPTSSLDAFIAANDMLDREMVTSFLLTARTMIEARYGSRADSETAQDSLDELIAYARSRLCKLLTEKMFYWLVRCSYGVAVADEFCPVASMERASRPDFAANCSAVGSLRSAGWQLTNEQTDYLNTQVLGLPSGVLAAEPNVV